ncbi:MAG: hypothetical protein ACKO2L_19390 [Planctomycetaceae bacterium]
MTSQIPQTTSTGQSTSAWRMAGRRRRLKLEDEWGVSAAMPKL